MRMLFDIFHSISECFQRGWLQFTKLRLRILLYSKEVELNANSALLLLFAILVGFSGKLSLVKPIGRAEEQRGSAVRQASTVNVNSKLERWTFDNYNLTGDYSIYTQSSRYNCCPIISRYLWKMLFIFQFNASTYCFREIFRIMQFQRADPWKEKLHRGGLIFPKAISQPRLIHMINPLPLNASVTVRLIFRFLFFPLLFRSTVSLWIAVCMRAFHFLEYTPTRRDRGSTDTRDVYAQKRLVLYRGERRGRGQGAVAGTKENGVGGTPPRRVSGRRI